MLAKRVESGHQWVALLAPLSLKHRPRMPLVIIPQILRGLPVEHAYEGQGRRSVGKRHEPLQHRLPANEVKGANAIDGYDGRTRVSLSKSLEHVGNTLSARTS